MERKLVILKDDIDEKHIAKIIQSTMSTHLESKVSHIVEFSDHTIQIRDIEMNIVDQYQYDDIECINLSMCSRYAGGTGRFGGIRTSINIDFDILLKDQTILLEIVSPVNFQKVSDIIIHQNIDIVDMVGVIDLFKKYPDYEKRIKYLEIHFNDLAKKYKLDHPRFKSRFKK